ncbi:MAG: hypothetical protein SFZ23_01760 [Planctomycetota bacterium]|nr:hypothetical protein [Planctomycetota bacterium]
MSLKWRRTKAWDDANLTGHLRPLWYLLRIFSSIATAVVLLTLVALYGVVASVPIGMLAQIPTWLLYGLSAVGVMLLTGGLPVLALRKRSASTPLWQLVVVACMGALVGLAAWARFIWPELRYVPGPGGGGFRLFGSFIDANIATTLRRLPILEMTELEFYSWWPLKLILGLFVVNMVVATVRRIEFTFKNIGVLTVHTGIVLIALGSIYYGGLKREGDTLLMAGVPGRDGTPAPGPLVSRFYDGIKPALIVAQNGRTEQRPLTGLPRYNDYNLAALVDEAPTRSALQVAGMREPWDPALLDRPGKPARRMLGPLDLVPVSLAERAGVQILDPDIALRVVGYASYAEPREDWLRVEPRELTRIAPGQSLNPLRVVKLELNVPGHQDPGHGEPGHVHGSEDQPRSASFAFTLLPTSPAKRVSGNAAISIEYLTDDPGAPFSTVDQRWTDLSESLPDGTEHALVVEIPGPPSFRRVYPLHPGLEIEVGDTGWKLDVQDVRPEPPFPIITKGYEGATSSVAIVRVTPPEGSAGAGGVFERYVYHRFPEIAQDMQPAAEGEMPRRSDPDARIRLSYIDATKLNIYLRETPRAGGDRGPQVSETEPLVRAIARIPGGQVVVVDEVAIGGAGLTPILDEIVKLGVVARWDHAERVERPAPVPEGDRDRENVGNHAKAMVGVEVAIRPVDAAQPTWSRVVWVPFARYMGIGNSERRVQLPDGRSIMLSFGRLQHQLPGFDLQLLDFEMIAYDHRGAPRDYQSMVRVVPAREKIGVFEGFEHITKLNAPLRAPFMWREDRNMLANVGGRLLSGLNPHQFKFSQAGWDAEGWKQSQARADRGEIPRPFAQFTILGVGNNPGIHVIALGGILMGLGIPWAFYVKPWLVQREKRRIQKQLAEGTYRRPTPRGKSAEPGPRVQPAHSNGVHVPGVQALDGMPVAGASASGSRSPDESSVGSEHAPVAVGEGKP